MMPPDCSRAAKRPGILLSGLLLSVFVAAARAQEPGPVVYDVELVVFQHLAGNATPEDWMLEERLGRSLAPIVVQDGEESVIVPMPGSIVSGVERQALPRERFRLTAIAAALQRSRNYRPVAHFGWSQAGSPLNAAVPMPLDAFLPPGPLSGSAALARGRFLHLTLDLAFQPEGDFQRYILRQTRRMRSTERHYIDHPQFGVIALVTPLGQAASP